MIFRKNYKKLWENLKPTNSTIHQILRGVISQSKISLLDKEQIINVWTKYKNITSGKSSTTSPPQLQKTNSFFGEINFLGQYYRCITQVTIKRGHLHTAPQQIIIPITDGSTAPEISYKSRVTRPQVQTRIFQDEYYF